MIRKLLGRRKLLLNGALGAAVAIVGVTAYASVGTKSAGNAAVATTRVTRGTVLSSVSATGNVSANRDIGLSFGGAGTVTDVLVKPGDKVTAGQALAHIDGVDAQNSLALAQAQLASAQQKLKDDTNGLTAVERAQLDISEQQADQSVKTAQASLDNARTNADLDKTTLQTTVDQSIANAAMSATQYQAAVDQATTALSTDNSQYITDNASLVNANNTLNTAQTAYTGVTTYLVALQADKADCPGTDPGARTTVSCSSIAGSISSYQSLQSQDASALNDAKSNYNSLTNTVASEKTKLVNDTNTLTNVTNTQKSGLLKDGEAVTNAKNAQTVGLAKDQQAIVTAQNALDNANLAVQATHAGDLVKLEPAKAATIDSDRASVITAQNAAATAQKAVDKTAIIAPVAATVASVAGNPGDTVSSSGTTGSSSSGSSAASSAASSSSSSTTGFVVLTDVSTLHVKAGFSEADAAKVQAGQAATVTFDALPNTSAPGQVVSVSPTSTVVSNVVTYEVTVLLSETTNGVKPGMTASVQVTVDKAENVLELPSSAVTTAGGASFVNVQNGKVQERRTVVTGLKGDDATEIVSGLKEGDSVVTSTGAAGANNANANLANRLRQVGGVGGGLGGGGGAAPVVGGGR